MLRYNYIFFIKNKKKFKIYAYKKKKKTHNYSGFMCVSQWVIISFFYHHALLTWKSLYKYKLLWGGREGRGLSLYNEVSHTYMLNDDDVVLPKWMRLSTRLSCWLLWIGYLALIFFFIKKIGHVKQWTTINNKF